MERNFTLTKGKTGLLVVDAQERLFRYVDRPCDTLEAMQKAVRGFQIMGLPVVVTEQYPEGLGSTVEQLKKCIGEQVTVLEKTSFSCLGDEAIRKHLLALPVEQWVIVGIEAHVCVLQTAKDLLSQGKQVVILNDGITSRSIYDYSTAIAELRDAGARISSTETVLFEILGDAKVPEFKEISALVK